MVALMPGGSVYTTENGCFAKTYGLDPIDEPTIYGGTTAGRLAGEHPCRRGRQGRLLRRLLHPQRALDVPVGEHPPP